MRKRIGEMTVAEVDAEIRRLHLRDNLIMLAIGLVCLVLVLILK